MNWIFIAALGIGFTATAGAQTLHVYGPGGPAAPMKECAVLFEQKTGVHVEVEAGPEAQWLAEAETDADIVYGGADYMLTQFNLAHPGFLKDGSRVELGDRAVGILVRPGNPKHIHDFKDLARPGLRLLDVNGAGQLGLWEDLAGRRKLIPAIQGNIALSVPNSGEGPKAWAAHPELDTWITYESWAKRMQGQASLVQLPEKERLYRGTPIALAARSPLRVQAEQFIQFLQSPVGHATFQKWGWR